MGLLLRPDTGRMAWEGLAPDVDLASMVEARMPSEEKWYALTGIAEHLTKHGFLFCVDAGRARKRFVVKADDLLTAFLSLERDAIAAKGANENATPQSVV
jgi:hypothetical protein